MMLEAVLNTQQCQITMLQKIVRPVYQSCGSDERFRADAVRKVAGDERRTGQRPVAHGPQ